MNKTTKHPAPIDSTSPTYVSWQPQFSVGVEEIDTQHKRLFAMINDLQNAIDHSRDNVTALEKGLVDLMTYAELHFSTEEELFRGEPGFDKHHREHWSFIRQAMNYVKRYNCDHDAGLITEIVEYLRHWLVEHILNIDQKQFKAMN
jgi:hemerythrin-like metal-binding protein